MNTFQDLAPRGTEQGVFMDFFRSLTGALLASFLVACGGGTTDQPQEASSGQRVAVTVTDTGADLTRGTAAGLSSPSYGTPAQGVDLVEMKQRLAKRFNGRFANEPEALMGDRGAYPAAKASWVNRKSFNRQPAQVHRFLNSITGAHFYTASDAEKAVIENSLPQFKYEGRAFLFLATLMSLCDRCTGFTVSILVLIFTRLVKTKCTSYAPTMRSTSITRALLGGQLPLLARDGFRYIDFSTIRQERIFILRARRSGLM